MTGTIADVVDAIGFGPSQILFSSMGGGIWAANGAEVLMLGSITKAVSDTWDLDGFQRGFVVSLVFVGIWVGNLLSGLVGDVYGRRPAITFCYTGVVVFSLLSSLSMNVWFMAICCLFVGASFGLGQPAWNALCSEISSTKHRVAMNIISRMWWPLGHIYSAGLLYADDPNLQELNWRRLLILASIPSVILGALAWCVLRESPHVLAHKGKHNEARKVLAWMAKLNGRSEEAEDAMRSCPKLADHCYDSDESDVSDEDSDVSDEDSEVENDGLSFRDTMSILWGPRLAFTTFTLCFSCAVFNILYYGGIYSFPQILPALHLKVSPAANVMLGAIFEVVGTLVSVLTMLWFSRKANMQIGYISQILSLGIFLHGICVKTSLSATLMQVGFLGMKMTVTIAVNTIYLYSTEVYPTAVRASGTAACISSGRIGAFFTPLIYEFLIHHTEGPGEGSWSFFVFLIAITVPAAALCACLPFETAGKKLIDTEPASDLDSLAADAKVQPASTWQPAKV